MELNIKRPVAATLFVLVLFSIFIVHSTSAQNGDVVSETQMFTLSLKDSTNNSIEYEDDQTVITLDVEVTNNEYDTVTAVVSMVHSLNGSTMYESFKEPVEIETNKTKELKFTILLDEPLDIELWESRLIIVKVRQDNRSNDVKSTLQVQLISVPYFRFEFDSVEPETEGERFLEGNPIDVHVKGDYLGNINDTLVARLLVDKLEVDSETFEATKSAIVAVTLTWKEPTDGNHTFKVEISPENGEETEKVNDEFFVEVEEKVEVPWLLWVGVGIIIMIIFLSITIFKRQTKKDQINGNSTNNGTTDGQIGSSGLPIVDDTQVVEKKKGKKKKGKKRKGKKKGAKKQGPTDIPPATTQPIYIQGPRMTQGSPKQGGQTAHPASPQHNVTRGAPPQQMQNPQQTHTQQQMQNPQQMQTSPLPGTQRSGVEQQNGQQGQQR